MKVKSIVVDIIGVLVLLSAIISIIPVLAQSNDLLVNGDFNEGLTGWNINVTVNVNYSWLSEFQGRSGVLYVESNSTTGGRFDIYQIINVNENVTAVYTISVYSNSRCSDCYIDVFIYNPNTSQYYPIDRIYPRNFSGWESFEKYVNIPNGSWEFYILIDSYESGLYVAIDSVHLLVNSSDTVAVMGGEANNIEVYYLAVAYAPALAMIVATIYYFIKRKLLIRKILKYRK